MNPWEKQPYETHKSWLAFCKYRDMGPSRTLEKIRIMLGKDTGYMRHLEHWSAKYKWVSRANAYDNYLDKRTRSAVEAKIVKERVKQAELELGMANKLNKVVDNLLAKNNGLTTRTVKTFTRDANGNVIEQVDETIDTNNIHAKIEQWSKLRRRALSLPLDHKKVELDLDKDLELDLSNFSDDDIGALEQLLVKAGVTGAVKEF